MTWRDRFKKIWHFIWEDDSLLSWVVNILLAFVLIKFLLYPGLGFVLQTTHPVVAVVSGSMEHDGSFTDWWGSTAICSFGQCTQEQFYSEHGINMADFKEFSFKNGFNKGDIIFLHGSQNLKKGDVIVFQAARADPIIHRIIDVGDNGYQTKGDHNSASITDLSVAEVGISDERIIGYSTYGKGSVAWFRIPYLGYIKIWAVDLLNLVK